MAKKMLVDATHSEETRVAVVDGNRLVDFDYESKVRKQLKGSIFLAKVTWIEPSLQAAFVNFGGNRHGFLPFSEIHPDYFRIPIADREALLAEQSREMEERQAKEEAEDEGNDDDSSDEPDVEELGGIDDVDDALDGHEDDDVNGNAKPDDDDEDDDRGNRKNNRGGNKGRGNNRKNNRGGGKGRGRQASRNRQVETVGGDSIEGDQPVRPAMRKNYKIQEVVKRGQIMLIQVSKEERGNKGAAVTTYLSLPGRYCVLMPNSPRAGGVSRKIANFKDRKRMREILKELQVPEGMSVIMRTAGVARTKTEIKRDLDYLIRLWNNIRELTLESTAPALVHEEGNLIRRSIRDIYSRDIDEVLIAGERGYKRGREFMKMLIPSHVKNVKEYKDDRIPLFHRYQVEKQIDEIGTPTVVLPSGGYLVINPTEALVSVDVNSGKATKGRHIEETALKTNLESAEEVARQLKLRDLGGLVVIDFIDMEDRRNNRKVEQKLKNALSSDRARIQVGRISSFGLLELSRQRLNPSLTEAQFKKCPHCEGTGNIKTIDALSISVLRALEEEGIRDRADKVVLKISNEIALYILNNKRKKLMQIEDRYNFDLEICVADDLGYQGYEIEPEAKSSGGGSQKQNENNNNNNDNAQSDDDNKPSRGGRRRGKRGGKRYKNKKGNDDNNNDDNAPKAEKSDSADDNNKQSKADKSDDASNNTQDDNNKDDNKKNEDNKKSESKKPARGRKSTKKDDGKSVSGDKDDTDKGDDQKSEKPKAKPKAKTAAKKTSSGTKKTAKKDDKDKADDAPAAKDDKKDDKKDTKKSKAKTTRKASNDSKKAKEESVEKKDYEVVNEAPKEKKKGWWSK